MAQDTALPSETTTEQAAITWESLGFAPIAGPDDVLRGTVPQGLFILTTCASEAGQALGTLCKEISTSQPFAFSAEARKHYAYRLGEGICLPANLALPSGVVLWGTGSELVLPQPPPQTDLPVIEAAQLALMTGPQLDPVITGNPFAKFSLRGQADEIMRQAVEAKPLLGNLCLSGQATVWYAPPNAGKTLIMLKLLNDAVAEQRITPDNVYYLNCDDSSQGFADKIRLMDDLGCHTLAPGYQGFQPAMVPDLLRQMVEEAKARGSLIIIDTVKKTANLMDKNKIGTFTNACRTAVMAGATILGFAHTNKNPAASGNLQYGGTTDLRDDFDAAYIMGPLRTNDFKGKKVVQFDSIKARSGSSARQVSYVYADEDGVGYSERLASVRLLQDDELDGFRRIEEAKADAEIIDAITSCIRKDEQPKMVLAKAAAELAGVSQRAALRIIEKYTGTDPAKAKWQFQRVGHGKMIYTLLPAPTEEAQLAA